MIAAFIDLSLRRSRCRCQRFVREYIMKGETAKLPGMAVKKLETFEHLYRATSG